MGRPFVAVIAVVLVAALLIWWLTRGSSDKAPSRKRSTANETKRPGDDDTGSGSGERGHAPRKRKPLDKGVRKLKDAVDREALLRAIKAARQRRLRGDNDTTSSSGSGSNPNRPSLPGTLDKNYIRSVIRAAIPLLKECYTLARDTASELSGRVVMSFTIVGEKEVGGLVESAHIESKNAISTHKTMSECLTQTVLSLEFVPPAGGGKISVKYPLVFSNDDENK